MAIEDGSGGAIRAVGLRRQIPRGRRAGLACWINPADEAGTSDGRGGLKLLEGQQRGVIGAGGDRHVTAIVGDDGLGIEQFAAVDDADLDIESGDGAAEEGRGRLRESLGKRQQGKCDGEGNESAVRVWHTTIIP